MDFLATISHEDYVKCETASENWWSNGKKGDYGKGCANTEKDKCKVTRTGLLGEMAFSKIFNVPVSFEYKEFGKDEDFIIGPNKIIDVKTATYNYYSGLIQAKNEEGIGIPLKADIYVFGYVEKEDRNEKFAQIVFAGYATKEYISTLIPVIGKKLNAKHMNYEVKYTNLKPMILLLKAHNNYLEKQYANL